MPVKVRRVWITEDGAAVPESDTRLYDAKCEMCGTSGPSGVARHEGRFLCLGCLDDLLRRD